MRQISFPTVVAVLAAGVLTLPIVAVLSHIGADSDGVWRHLVETVLGRYVWNTVWLLLGVGVGALLLGVPTAWVISMYSFPGRRLLSVALLLPLAVPTYIMAYAYTDLLQFTGPVQSGLREVFGWGRGDYVFPEIRSLGGAIVTFSFVLYPYVFMLARAAFLEQSAGVLEAGRTLGRGAWSSFCTLALPLARPGIVAGVSLVLMESLAEYGAVDYFAVDTFTTGIYRTWQGMSSLVAANQLAAVMILIVLFLLVAERLGRGRARFHQSPGRYRVSRARRLSRARSMVAVGICLLPVLGGFVIPVAFLLHLAVGTDRTLSLSALANLAGNSFLLATLSAMLIVSLGLFLAYAQREVRSPVAALGARVVSLGYAIPGSVIAVGVLAVVGAFDRLSGLFVGGTIAGLVFAYAVRFSAVALQALEAGLERIHPSLDEAARTLGAGSTGVLVRIHTRLMRGSILTAALLVFVDVMKELPATMIVRPMNFNTLAVQAHHYASTERLDQTALPALLIVLVGLGPVMLLSRQIDRTRGGKTETATSGGLE